MAQAREVAIKVFNAQYDKKYRDWNSLKTA
jgi:hypothetical protein